ncbi:bacteriocin immunity protein [Pseudomonas fluorescens]|uniref:Bacteriocin immunity protein n=1 Tax=Pseudomonas fluorescens TaxID=294 RepID=A0AAE2PY89_PSEFL|nr:MULTISPECIES: bacteriocin immunity protein [Pseudomonas]AZF19085.1 bacteriocin immunity protein [Pseudomonas sp. R3-52-08]AZF24515.1 bacteriocin immunity protein [Pseudomonas sp. R2-60-08W]AZF29810.1 bacteriocin immunity protein [Pseudomonas sp. R4-35-07]MBA1427986.1 bacteriocin immunity protein [Pseudomonas orientalis]MBD8147967.1 bacteriocin immunity protein [Pseudomonas fluorescens]
MELKSSISEYTEAEFLEFMKEIFKENIAKTDDQLDILLEHFERITEHPESTDLIYYAATDAESTPEAITNKVKEWRAANGKPGFKTA